MAESPYDPPSAPIDVPTTSDQLTMERPKEITFVIWLVVLTFVLGWIGTLVSWEYQMSLQSPLQFALNQVFGVAFALWIYYKIYQGRNWARIVILVFSVFGWLMLLVPAVNRLLLSAPTISKLGMIIGHLIQLAILWLLFLSPGRHWFRKRVHHAVA